MKHSDNYKQKFWDSYSKKYDSFISKHASKTYATVINNIKQELEPGSMVLEIATGTGLLSFAIASMVKHITAIDYSPRMINIAKQKQASTHTRNITFSVGNAYNLSFDKNEFDIVIASNVFHLLPSPEIALSEIKRVLKDNGTLLIPTYCHGNNIKSHILSRIMTLTGFSVWNRWSVESFRKFVTENGFMVQKEHIITDKITLSYIVASKKEAAIH